MLKNGSETGTCKRHLLGLCLSVSITMPWAAPLRAQEIVEELPPIIVEGTSIAVKPVVKNRSQDQVSGATGSASSQSQTDDGGAGTVSTDDDVEAASGESAVEAGYPAQNQGTAVSVVTRQDLERRQIRHAADALRGLPGVHVSRSGGVANETVVRLRGAESNHTLVLIDGVEVNPGISGIFDFSNLTTQDIERIEVLRGPQSGLYGSNAVGGVINVITRSGKGPLTVTAVGEGGSFGTNAEGARISGGNDDAHAIATVHRNKTDGYNLSPFGSEDDGSTITNFSFAGGFRPWDPLKIEGGFRQSRTAGDRDGFDGILNGLNVSSDDFSIFRTRVRVGHIAATLSTFDDLWLHELRLSAAETDTADTDRGLFPRFFQGIDERTKISYKSTVQLETPALSGVRHYVTGLVEDERQTFEQPSDNAIERERNRLTTAAELRGEYFDSLFLSGTVRKDDNDAFDDFTSWRVTGSLKASASPLRLHSSAGTGVKDPSFAELFGSFTRFVPNPNLQPEESFGWDAGIEATVANGRGVIDVTYFEADLTNEITEVFTFNPATGFFDISAVNLAGESTRRGVEVAASYRILTGLTLGGSYTYLDAEEPDGQEELRRAPHTGRVDVNYAFDAGRGNFNIAAIYNGDMKDNIFNLVTFTGFRGSLDAYWLATVSGSYEVQPGVEIFGRVENAFDEDYREIFGRETAGVAAYAGVRLTYEDPQTRDWARGR